MHVGERPTWLNTVDFSFEKYFEKYFILLKEFFLKEFFLNPQ